MRIEKVSLFVLCLILGFTSCKKDDGDDDIVEIVVRDRTEQQIEDDAALLDYLDSHYYNSTEISNLTDPSLSDIKITALLEGETEAPADHTLLSESDKLETKPVVFADTDYMVYILRLNQGGGDFSPSFADDILLLYEGFNFDGTVFDSAVTPVEFDLVSLIPGWRKVIPEFNTAESFMITGDGTVDYMNTGLGVMFLPSGLAYFSNATTGISAYTSIIFKFELLNGNENDHDSDGIPSYLEDLNGDGEFTLNTDAETLDGDDTDDNGVPNYFDNDDDGDGVLTINEDIDGDGDPTNDLGSNGIPKYLDPEETASK